MPTNQERLASLAALRNQLTKTQSGEAAAAQATPAPAPVATPAPLNNNAEAQRSARMQKLMNLRASLNPPEQRVAETTARDTNKVLTRQRENLSRQGIQLPPAEFEPPERGTRDFLHNFSQGTLSLPRNSLSAEQEQDNAARIIEDFGANAPGALNAIRAEPTGQAMTRLVNHAKALGRIAYTQPSPKEKLSAIQEMTADWGSAHAQGFVSNRSSVTGDTPITTEGLSPDLIGQVASKVLHLSPLDFQAIGKTSDDPLRQQKVGPGVTGISSALNALDPRGPFGNEVAAFQNMGGADYALFLQKKMQTYVHRRRMSTLTGQPAAPLFDETRQIPGNLSFQASLIPAARREAGTAGLMRDDIPDGPRTSLFDLTAISPFMAEALQRGQEVAGADAQREADLYNAAIREKGAMLGPISAQAWRPDGSPAVAPLVTDALETTALPAVGSMLNAVTLGAFGVAIEAAGQLPEAASASRHALLQSKGYYLDDELVGTYKPGTGIKGFRNMRSSMLRSLVTLENEQTRDRHSLHSAILSQFPNLSEGARDRMNHELYSGRNVMLDSLAWWSSDERNAVTRGVADVFGIRDPAVQGFIANTVGAVTDDEAGFFFTMLGTPATFQMFKRGFKGGSISQRVVRKNFENPLDFKRKLPKHEFHAFDDGTTGAGRFSRASVEDRGRMANDLIGKIGREVKDIDKARELTGRLQDVLTNERLPLDATTQSWMYSALEKAKKTVDEFDVGDGKKLSRQQRKALAEVVAPALNDLPFMDAGFVLRGVDDVFINEAASADLARRSQEWLDLQRNSSSLIPVPRRLTFSRQKAHQITSGLMEEAARLTDNAQTAGRVDRILAEVERNATHRKDTFGQQLEYHAKLAEDAVAEHRRLVTEETARTLRLDTDGGTVPRPNDLVGTPLYNKVEEVMANPDPQATRDMFLSRNGNLNRRAIAAIGGKPLLEAMDNMKRAQDDILRGSPHNVPPQARVLTGEMEKLFRSSVEDWHRKAGQPTSRTITAAELPRTDLAESIAAKLEEGGIPALTPEELQWLNKHRPEGSHIQSADGIETALAPSIRMVDDLTNANARLDEFTTTINEARVAISDPTKAVKLALPKKVRKQIAEYLDDPAAHLLDGERSYTPLYMRDVKEFQLSDELIGRKKLDVRRAATPEELNGLQAFDDAMQFVTQEKGLIDNGHFPMTKLEMDNLRKTKYAIAAEEASRLPGEISAELIKKQTFAGEGLRQYHLHESASMNRWMEKNLTRAERRQIFEDMKNGTSSNDLVMARIQSRRLELLEEALSSGLITGEAFQRMSGHAYYHGVYLDKGISAEMAGLEAVMNGHLPQRFAPLRADAKALRFKRPEVGGKAPGDDTFWVQWKDKGEVKARKGFDGPEAAGAFLETLPDHIKSAEINPPMAFSAKELAGLVTDPAISNMTMAEGMVEAINNNTMQQVISKTAFTKTAQDLTSAGAEFSSAGTIATSGKRKYLRVDSEHLPHLRGKYIDSEVVRTLHNYSDQYKWSRGVTDAWSEAAHSELGRNDGLVSRAFEASRKTIFGEKGFFKRFSNIFAMSKVAFSVRAIRNGVMGNTLLYTRQAGLDTLSPTGARHYYQGLRESFKGLRAVNEGGLKADPIWEKLAKNDNVRMPGLDRFDKELGQLIDKHWTGFDALHARADAARGHWQRALDEGDLKGAADWHAKHLTLMDEAQKLGPKTTKAFMKDWKKAVKAGAKKLDEFTSGSSFGSGGRSASAVWDFYSKYSLDLGSKYSTFKYLTEVEGLADNVALDRISTFMQHLHRVPKRVKEISGNFEGAMFAGFTWDQIRILGNSLRHNPQLWAADMAQLATWNSAMLYRGGSSPQDYAEWYATRNGLDNQGAFSQGLNLMRSLAGGIIMPQIDPQDGTGFERLDIGNATFDVFANQSPQFRETGKRLLGDNDNPVAHMAVDTILAAFSRVQLSAPAMQLASAAIFTGRDDRGDQISSPQDYLAMTARMALPDLTPGIGRDATRLWRIAEGTDVDPATLRKKTLGEFAREVLGNIKTEGNSTDALRSVVAEVLKAQGQGASFIGEEKYDELASTRIAREGGRGDAAFKEEVNRRITKEYYEEHGPEFIGPNGERIKAELQEGTLDRAMERASVGTLRNRFNKLKLEAMINAYSIWRKKIPIIEKATENWMLDDIDKTIRSNRFMPSQTRNMGAIRDYWEADPNVSEEVKQHLRKWHTDMVTQQVDKTR